MFQKLFDLVDDFVNNFSRINTLEELAKIAMDVFAALKEAFIDSISTNMDQNEKIFDELMDEQGLWHKIGEKIKKAMRDKNELLKVLLYLTTIMNEFQNRLREKQKAEKKYKAFDKIMKKYMKLLKDILDNKDLSDFIRERQIKDTKKALTRELKFLEHDR